MSSRLPLWRQPDFRRLWAAQAVSDFGARITREGLPMMAVTGLAASPSQLGVLAALGSGAALLVGLTAGGFVDRRKRRHILIGADLVRAAMLVTLPVAALLHRLSIWHVYAAAGVVASASVLFIIADHAYLPGLVARDDLTEGNAKISATESVAEVGGPALAGLLFQWLTAQVAVALNAVTYLVSAAFLATIRTTEPPHDPAAPRGGWTDAVRSGAAAAWRDPLVRPLLLASATSAFFGGIFAALYILFCLRVVGLTPGLLGLIIACGGLGAFLGSAIVQPLARRLGTGRAILAGGLGTVLAVALIPLAPARPAAGMAVLMASQLLGDASAVVAMVLSVSLRQSLIPQGLLGRVGATFQTVGGGAAVLGALAGGALAEGVGPRAALGVAAAGFLLPPLVVFASPLRSLREAPAAG